MSDDATEPEAVAVAVANGQRWLLSSFGSLTPGTWETVDIDFYRHHAHAWVVGVDHDGVDWQSNVELLPVERGRWRSGAVTTTSWDGWPQIAATRPDRAWPQGDWVLGCDVALSSRLAYPEVCAALAVAGRNHDLTESEVSSAYSDWELFWASVRPVELSADVERAAGSLAAAHQLCGSDAVHLARALALGTADLTVAVWDKRLHAGAAAVGLSVAPATLG